ncbi:hypothetical protein [Methanobrevibacter sp.]|uniref:hypothetical protein n=1 Tax=Methanobrevibacter sp. TaxID=66852 RepID=UPI00388E7A9E
MRRKKDDKRVLIPGNSQKHASNRKKSRRIFGRNQNNRSSRNNRINRNNRYNDKPKKKRSKLTLFLMILALVGFVAGVGMGISLSFDDSSDDGPHIENVTKEMTTNLNDTEKIVYDPDFDALDYNSNQDVVEYNLTEVEPSY